MPRLVRFGSFRRLFRYRSRAQQFAKYIRPLVCNARGRDMAAFTAVDNKVVSGIRRLAVLTTDVGDGVAS
jgi:hypothetical protein